jgi:hypothetical protein
MEESPSGPGNRTAEENCCVMMYIFLKIQEQASSKMILQNIAFVAEP